MSNNETNTNPQPPKQPSASERLGLLEQGIAALHQLSELTTKDLSVLKKTLQLLNNKVDAMAKATLSGEVPSDEVLNRIMIENNVEDLTAKVAGLVQGGFLVAEEQVGDNPFLVCRQLDNNGDVTDPRVQFAVKALESLALQAKFFNTKVGDRVEIRPGVILEILEAYKLQQPPEPEAPTDTPVDVTPPGAPQAEAPASN